MSLVDIALLPIRVGRGIADTLLQAVIPTPPAPPSELLVAVVCVLDYEYVLLTARVSPCALVLGGDIVRPVPPVLTCSG